MQRQKAQEIWEEIGASPSVEDLVRCMGENIVKQWAIQGYRRYMKAKLKETAAGKPSPEKYVARLNDEQIKILKELIQKKRGN